MVILIGFLAWLILSAVVAFAYAFVRVNYTETGRARYAEWQAENRRMHEAVALQHPGEVVQTTHAFRR